jgi:hypothetical protein
MRGGDACVALVEPASPSPARVGVRTLASPWWNPLPPLPALACAPLRRPAPIVPIPPFCEDKPILAWTRPEVV